MMRRVLVTGARRGIGRAIAQRFAREQSAEVVALDKTFEECDLPASIERVTFDLREVHAIPDMIASLGAIDVLVNNAGVLHLPSPANLPSGDLGFTEEQREEILTVNVRAPVALIEALAPQFIARGRDSAAANTSVGGRIVNIASVSGFTGHPDLWYGASKAALLNAKRPSARPAQLRLAILASGHAGENMQPGSLEWQIVTHQVC